MTEENRQTLVNALHTAARYYDECARAMESANLPPLVVQFRRQVADARRLADAFENGTESSL